VLSAFLVLASRVPGSVPGAATRRRIGAPCTL